MQDTNFFPALTACHTVITKLDISNLHSFLSLSVHLSGGSIKDGTGPTTQNMKLRHTHII